MGKPKKKDKPKLIVEHKATVVAGPEGPSLYIDDYRVSGPKPWGGGKILYEFQFDSEDLEESQRSRLRRAPLKKVVP